MEEIVIKMDMVYVQALVCMVQSPQINISKRMIAVLIPDDGSGKSMTICL